MRNPFRASAFLAAACAVPSLSQNLPAPTLTGLITRLTTPTDLDVNGLHLLLNPKTRLDLFMKVPLPTYTTVIPDAIHPWLGESVDVYGKLDPKTHTMAVDRLVLYPRGEQQVAGTAILDAILPLPPGAAADNLLIRADGYPILITRKTQVSYDRGLTSAKDLHVNLWAEYRGKQNTQGIVVAEKLTLRKNIISRRQDKLREKWEYDPASIDPATRQDTFDKAIRGDDPLQIPPHKDDIMQARVDRIGAKLVPRYQFDFPYTEETRIDFRFYLVDMPHWRDARALPNGIILVPYQVVDRMRNDAQLAAILAEKVACLLEKQATPLPATDAGLALDTAEIGALLVAPAILTLPVGLDVTISARKRFVTDAAQRARVSLSLLHDAGFDLTEAPIAWWLLASKKSKDVTEAVTDIPIPSHSLLLYQTLGTTWPQEPPTLTASAPAVPQ